MSCLVPSCVASLPMQTRVKSLCAGIFGAVLAFVPSFALFDWALILYWEWQHEGRKMKFTLWADERALLLALSLCAVIFYTIVRHFQRQAPPNHQFNRRSLVIAAISGVAVIYVSLLAYFFTIVGHIFSSQDPR